MTREEKAIIYFKDMRKRLCDDYLLGVPKDSVAYKVTMAEKEFYDTAIKALEQQPCDKYIKEIDHLRKYIYKLETQIAEQEPILDKILDKAKQEIRYGENKAYNADFTMGCEYAIGVIERMLEGAEE